MTTNIIHIDRDALDARLDHGNLWDKGWGDWQNPEAPTCLHGAIRFCQPVPGDAYLIEEVGGRFGFGTSDNDDQRSWSDVLPLVPSDITDDMLADTFGPQWEPHVALVRRAAVLTDSEARSLASARDSATALAVRDLIGQHGFTQAHYDTLTGPWATVIGKVHPDDTDRKCLAVRVKLNSTEVVDALPNSFIQRRVPASSNLVRLSPNIARRCSAGQCMGDRTLRVV